MNKIVKLIGYRQYIIRILATACLLFVMPAALFSADQTEAKPEKITIVAVGDLYLGGDGDKYVAQNDYAYSYLNILGDLGRADVAVANLEVPFTTEKVQFMEKMFILKARPDAVQAVRRGGFSVVTLANNHMMDYGPKGLKDTLTILDKSGIKRTGAGMNLEEARRAAIVEVKGKKIAFLSYSLTYPTEFYASKKRGGTAQGHMPHVLADIKDAKSRYDYVIVSFHWGEEMMRTPKYYQKENAHLAIDAGATAVIGHHPHVLQSVERYKDGVIFYSMGNFVFGSMTTRVPSGMIAVMDIAMSDNKLSSVELIPLNVYNREVFFSPRKFEGKRLDAAFEDIRSISKEFRKTSFIESGGRLFVDMTQRESTPIVKTDQPALGVQETQHKADAIN